MINLIIKKLKFKIIHMINFLSKLKIHYIYEIISLIHLKIYYMYQKVDYMKKTTLIN